MCHYYVLLTEIMQQVGVQESYEVFAHMAHKDIGSQRKLNLQVTCLDVHIHQKLAQCVKDEVAGDTQAKFWG